MKIVLTEKQKQYIVEKIINEFDEIELSELEDEIYEEVYKINEFYKQGILLQLDFDEIVEKVRRNIKVYYDELPF